MIVIINTKNQNSWSTIQIPVSQERRPLSKYLGILIFKKSQVYVAKLPVLTDEEKKFFSTQKSSRV